MKREVLEEAGLQFEPLSLIGLEVSHMWYRYLFVGRAIGRPTQIIFCMAWDGVHHRDFSMSLIGVQYLSLFSILVYLHVPMVKLLTWLRRSI